MKIKTIIFNFMTFSVLLTPIIHAALPSEVSGVLLNTVRVGNLRGVQELIESFNIDPNTADSKGKTLLILAAIFDYFEIVKYLLERGDVDPNLQNNQGQTALMEASLQGHENIAKLLLKHNANPDLQNNQKETALMEASTYENENIVKLLLEHNANPDLQDNQGETALMKASSRGRDKIVKLLLQYSNLYLKNRREITALDKAVMYPNIQKMISEEINRRAKMFVKIPPFLRKKYGAPSEIADIILEMEGTKPSQ